MNLQVIPGELPIAVRPFNEIADYGYILATWSRGYHKVHPFNFIPNQIYVPQQTKVINNVLERCNTLVACIDDSPDDIVGYLITQPFGEDLIVHWSNVKSNYRRFGVMKTLLNKSNADNKTLLCSHYFDLFKQLKDRYHLVYDPSSLKEYI